MQSFFKKPYIVTGHGGDVTSLNKGILRKLKVRCLKNAKYITVVSRHLKAEVQKLYPTENIDIISMGCKTENFGKQFAVPDYFNQGDQKVVLFVGRLAEKKGVTYLIEAMKQIDAKLVIVGDGPLRESLEVQAKEQGDKISFLGAKTHEELKTIYASADLFVAPSVTAKDGDQEGFGLVMLEAMASGLPIVASDSGGISDLIHDGENGYLVEERDADGLAEKINLLLKDKLKYSLISEIATKSAEKYDYHSLAQKYNEILRKLT